MQGSADEPPAHLWLRRRRDAHPLARTPCALLALPTPPDAVFCFNDLLAVGALRAAAEARLRVPDELAVVGFDGSEEGACTSPTLTTIAPDKAAIAEEAVARISARINGDAHAAPEEIRTPFRLEVRESTTPRTP